MSFGEELARGHHGKDQHVTDVLAAHLLEHLRGRVARYKVPKKVELVESVPVSAAGKILKRELRERAIAADKRGHPHQVSRGNPRPVEQ